MKKLSRKLLPILIFMFAAYTLTVLNCGAMEINSYNANVGDTVFYELHAGSCPKDVQAVDISIYYDSGALEYVEDSIKLDNLTGYVVNTNLEGEIRFNAIDLQGFKFQADKILAELQFKVVSDYNPYPFIRYEVRSFIDSDMTEQGATYTYDLTYINSVPGADAVSSNITSSNVASESDSDTDSATDSDTSTDTVSDTDTSLSSADSEKNIDTVTDSQEDDKHSSTASSLTLPSVVESPELPATADTPKTPTAASYGVIFAVSIAVVAIVAAVLISIKRKSDLS